MSHCDSSPIGRTKVVRQTLRPVRVAPERRALIAIGVQESCAYLHDADVLLKLLRRAQLKFLTAARIFSGLVTAHCMQLNAADATWRFGTHLRCAGCARLEGRVELRHAPILYADCPAVVHNPAHVLETAAAPRNVNSRAGGHRADYERFKTMHATADARIISPND